jgi:hypothetical protein
MRRLISWAMIVVYVTTLISGCGLQEPQGNRIVDNAVQQATPEEHKILIEDNAEKHVILMANLELTDVVLLRDTLEAEGYAYRETNSIVMIQNNYESVWREDFEEVANDEASLKPGPNGAYTYNLVSADTVVWQVFENAVYDSSLHTGVITLCHSGQNLTVLAELDVSTPEGALLRSAQIVGGAYTPNGPETQGVKDILKCIHGCCNACDYLCVLLGPIIPECKSLCCAACVVGCAIGALLALF